jgi:aminoglycoside 3-N-acetyltransferase
MSETAVIQRTPQPVTVQSLAQDLRQLGVSAGQVVVVHSSLSQLGWVCGGAVAVIEALLSVLGPAGTLVMPAHTPHNSDPANWENPPVPQDWWKVIRETTPPFDPQKTPSWGMGVIAETFRSYPGVLRSSHPVTSFCALGADAARITATHSLEHGFGQASPLGQVYALDGYVLLLGVGHSSNSSLHVAEVIADIPRQILQEGTAVLEAGQRRWVRYQTQDYSSEDFDALGEDFEAVYGISAGRVGVGAARLLRQRTLIDWAVGWLERHRR